MQVSYKLIVASAHDTGLPSKSVHLIVTSSPYYSLRAYSGNQAVEWPTVSYSPQSGLQPVYDRPKANAAWHRVLTRLPDGLTDDQLDDIKEAVFNEFIVDMLKPPMVHIPGCDPDCVHEWVDGPVKTQTPQRDHDSNGNFGDTRGTEASRQGMAYKVTQGATCQRCGGWRGGLGSEPTIEAFIGHLILVLREMHRVLRDDGICFFNLGDSYAGSGGAHAPHHNNEGLSKSARRNGVGHTAKPASIPAKNLMMIPARFALAAQADGWIVRSAMPWIKRNGLPDSTEDKPGCAIESVFMLVKQERYYFDMEAVKQPVADSSINRLSQDIENQVGTVRANGGAKTNGNLKAAGSMAGRNLRAADLFFRTWEGMLLDDCGDPLAMVINLKGYSGPHYGVFPPELPEMAILAGTSAAGVCPICQAPWRRCVEHTTGDAEAHARPKRTAGMNSTTSTLSLSGHAGEGWRERGARTNTTGWAQSCSCPAHDPIPATILDPFVGSGTTCMVAQWLGRDSIGLDLSDEYHQLAHERINTPRERVEDKRAPADGQMGLFEEFAL